MNKLDKDIHGTYRLVKGDYNKHKYSPVYYCSNERLKELFDSFSVRDKDVLTVLASSDQLFYAYLNGAKSVYTFDRNKLTKYYYYLRKWVIKYYDSFYPDKSIIFDTSDYIAKLLDRVECDTEDEREAYYYWNEYTCKVKKSGFFYPSLLIEDNIISDVSSLKDKLDKNKLSFSLRDVTKRVSDRKKYDIIITSNLLEYIHETLELKRTRDNLSKLLNSNGMVICSYVVGNKYSSFTKMQKEIFRNSFYIEEFPFKGLGNLNTPNSVGYAYIKK